LGVVMLGMDVEASSGRVRFSTVKQGTDVEVWSRLVSLGTVSLGMVWQGTVRKLRFGDVKQG